jgi:hypothetical protein
VSKGKFLGYDSKGTPVFVGSMVNHTVKGFTNGVVGQESEYKGEVAAYVNYANGPSSHLNRLSRMIVVDKQPKAVEQPVSVPFIAPLPEPVQLSGRFRLTILVTDEGVTVDIDPV